MPSLDDSYDYELAEQIDELIDSGDLEEGTPAHGIALKVVNEGYDSLSPKQRYVYDKYVWPLVRGVAEQWALNARINSMPD